MGLVCALADTYSLQNDEVVVTNGSDEALYFAFLSFCDSQHPAVFADITYGFYKVFAQLTNTPYREIPLKKDFTIDPHDYANSGATVFLANPNAPTGIALSRDSIEQIIATNPDNVVVVDEAYVDFGAESCLELIRKYENLLIIRTFSKSRAMAGARLGFAMGSRELIRDLNTIRFSTNPYNINRMTLAAGIGALEDEEYFYHCLDVIRENRAFASRELKNMGFEVTDSSANFLFARHPKIGGAALYEKLKASGVLIRHFELPRIGEYNRITVGTKEQMNLLLQKIRIILEKEDLKAV